MKYVALLRRLERSDEAAAAYRHALALEMNSSDRRFLEGRLTALTSGEDEATVTHTP